MTPVIHFDPDQHIYTMDGRVLSSVTQTIGRLKQPFDAPAVAQRVARKSGRTAEAVLAEWKAVSDTALALGTQTHAEIEACLRGTPKETGTAQYQAWLSWWDKVRDRMEVRAVERIVGDGELGIAGTMDALLFSPKKGLYILDWKTGDKFNSTSQYGDRLREPFDDLEQCELNLYSLQVSLYRLILERQGEEIAGAGILHLSSERARYCQCLDFRDRLLEWLI